MLRPKFIFVSSFSMAAAQPFAGYTYPGAAAQPAQPAGQPTGMWISELSWSVLWWNFNNSLFQILMHMLSIMPNMLKLSMHNMQPNINSMQQLMQLQPSNKLPRPLQPLLT